MSNITELAKVGDRLAYAIGDALESHLPEDPYAADAIITAAVAKVLEVAEIDAAGNPKGHLFITGEGDRGYPIVECSVHGGISIHLLDASCGPDPVLTFICDECASRKTVTL